MKDRNGKDIEIDALAVVLDHDEMTGRTVRVRAFSTRLDSRFPVRVDDDVEHDDAADEWDWAAWLAPSNLAVIGSALAPV